MQAEVGCNRDRDDRTVSPWALEVGSWLELTRRRTLDLVESLSDGALATPVRDFMSPLVWDLGHIADFEQRWLVDGVEGRCGKGAERRFDALATPRSARGDVGLPSKSEAQSLMDSVRAEALALLGRADSTPRDPLLRDGYVYRMVIQHEGQHQETMLQSLDLQAEGGGQGNGSSGGESPSADHAKPVEPAERVESVDDSLRVHVPGGLFLMGTDDRTWAYDNERGRHQVSVAAFDIERYPVTNRRWARFMDDGGYERSELWSAGGNGWRIAPGCEGRPQGWAARGTERTVRRFGEVHTLLPDEPVQHVCYWEAEAFARWCGGRLPTEAEWEKAASWDPETAAPRNYPWGARRPTDVGFQWIGETPERGASGGPGPGGLWGPERVGRRPALASPHGVEDMLGGVSAWTSSAFHPYPGFAPFPYPEYSEVFFGDTYRVLRGASWAAHPLLWRNSYRNWDLPQRRQIFAGVRVVYDR